MYLHNYTYYGMHKTISTKDMERMRRIERVDAKKGWKPQLVEFTVDLRSLFFSTL